MFAEATVQSNILGRSLVQTRPVRICGRQSEDCCRGVSHAECRSARDQRVGEKATQKHLRGWHNVGRCVI